MQQRLTRRGGQTSVTTPPPQHHQRTPPQSAVPAPDPFDGTALQFLPSFSTTASTPSPQQHQDHLSWDQWGGWDEEEKKSDTSGYSASSFRKSPESSYVGWWPGTQDPKGNTIAETSRTTDPTVSNMTEDDSVSPTRQLFPVRRLSLSQEAYVHQKQQHDKARIEPQYSSTSPIFAGDNDAWTPDPDFAPIPLTQDALAAKNRSEPSLPAGYSPAARGFTGLLHKTSPVPCLLDDEDDVSATPSSPDVFDGLSHISDSVFHNLSPGRGEEEDQPVVTPPQQNESFRMVPIMGLHVLQSSPEQFRNRATAHDFDDALTDSDVSTSDGYPRIPAIATMRHAGRRSNGAWIGMMDSTVLGNTPCHHHDRPNDVDDYAVDPRAMEAVVEQYRSLSSIDDDAATKLFALTEMRSRILEADVERGVERCGGTTVVDDTVTTRYMTTAHSIRDAMIVAKTWRDGATIQDVVHTAQLAQPLQHRWWLDDVDILQYRCPSLGPRYLRGFDMFTIGDCQSMLLKLANDRCMELRDELHDATADQIQAEDQMNNSDDGFSGMMSDAEMVYLAAMEQTKTISRQLVAAEQSFAYVKESVERLISKYERLLATIETGSLTGSVFSTNSCSDCGSEYWERFDRLWARRKRRAEIQAELAAREAVLATSSPYARRDKQKEIFQLREQLLDLRSEASSAHPRHDVGRTLSRQPLSTTTSNHTNNNNKDRLRSVKQRFRDRARQQQKVERPELVLLRSAGQEMVQQKDFYQRSLRAVER